MTKPTIIRKRDPARSEASLLEILIERNFERAQVIIKRMLKNRANGHGKEGQNPPSESGESVRDIS